MCDVLTCGAVDELQHQGATCDNTRATGQEVPLREKRGEKMRREENIFYTHIQHMRVFFYTQVLTEAILVYCGERTGPSNSTQG